MAYKLIDLVENLDSQGILMIDDDVTIQALNDSFGINIHHDLVITSHEAREIRGLLDYLLNFLPSEEEVVKNSARHCIKLLSQSLD